MRLCRGRESAAGTVGNALRGVPARDKTNVVWYARNGTESVPYSRFAAFDSFSHSFTAFPATRDAGG